MASGFPSIPGFGFYPSDEQILDYLKQRIQDHFQGSPPSNAHIIPEIELCKWKPWDLPRFVEQSTTGGSNRDEWYFFCPLKEKSSGKSSTRTVPNVGHWKVTSRKQEVSAGKLTGTKSILSFQRSGSSSSSDGSTWIIHEYHINPSCLGYRSTEKMPFVACCLKGKASNGSSEDSGIYDSLSPFQSY